MPADPAGLSSNTSATSAPSVPSRPRPFARSSVSVWICTPIQPRSTRPVFARSSMTCRAWRAGMAKPIPTLPPLGVKMAVFTPTTRPSVSKRGPPEFPRLMGASICRKSSRGPERISRPRADTMPAVTVPPSPKGLPTAITQSPTLTASESPNSAKGSASSTGMESRARSVFSSVPRSSASNWRPSCRVTVISSASRTTWWLVTMSPLASTTKPEPTEAPRNARGGIGAPSK